MRNTMAQMTSRERMLAAFALPPATLERSYAPGKWTGRQLLMHIADVEAVFLDRLRRGLSDAKPLYWAIEPDRWTARLATDQRNLDTAWDLFDACRRSYLDLIGTITAEEWDRKGVHSDYGMLTVRDLVNKCGWHCDHHLTQVEAIASGTPWSAAG